MQPVNADCCAPGKSNILSLERCGNFLALCVTNARTKEEFWHHNFHNVSFDCFKGDSTLLAMKQNS